MTPRVYILYCLKSLLIVWPEFELARKTKPASNGLLSWEQGQLRPCYFKKHPEYWTRKWNASMRPFRTLNRVCFVTYRLSMNSWKHLLVKKGNVWNTLSGHLVSMWFSSSNVFVEVSQAPLIVFLWFNMWYHATPCCCHLFGKQKGKEIKRN